jgi:hypothetical protein
MGEKRLNHAITSEKLSRRNMGRLKADSVEIKGSIKRQNAPKVRKLLIQLGYTYGKGASLGGFLDDLAEGKIILTKLLDE